MISLSSLLSPSARYLCCLPPVRDSTSCQPHRAGVVVQLGLSPVTMGAPGPFPSLRRGSTSSQAALHTPRLVVDVLPGVQPGLGRPVDFECFNLERITRWVKSAYLVVMTMALA